MADKKGTRKNRNKAPASNRKPRAPSRTTNGNKLSNKFDAAGQRQAFRNAVICNELALVEIYLKRHHLDVDQRDSAGNTALFEAARWGYADMITLLASYGADPDLKNEDGLTALMKAAEKNRVDAVQALIKAGAKLDLTDRDGETALALATWHEHTDICRALLDAGASFEVGKGALSPFDIVSRFDYDELAEMFKKHKARKDNEAAAAQSADVLDQLRRRKPVVHLKKRDDKPKP